MITKKDQEKLYKYAVKAAEYSYSPYSKYPVGAAVLTESGKIFMGTNIENASFGLTICAERIAIGNAIANGHKNFLAIAIYAKKGQVTPCGACRQFILEFGKTIDVVYKKDKVLVAEEISKLIPDGFTKKELR